LLIDKNNVYFSPGGNKTAMIALNKETGALVWKSESLNDNPSYTSPLMIEREGVRQIVNVSENYIFGVNPENGKIVWKFDFGKYQKERNNNISTPLYCDGEIYVTSGYDHASVKLKLEKELSTVSLVWTDTLLDNHHGGVVKIGNYIYGSNWKDNARGNWACIDWTTGRKCYEQNWKNKGSIISVDGMLIISEEKSGNVALLKADPKKFEIISSFKMPKGTGPYWSHPVIDNGVLYLRHGKALMAYNIKSDL
jgi:outer membrane protein assembly factor BamB